MMFNKLQPELKCCGAFNGYQDWGKHVPDSCLCPSDADRCEKIVVHSRLWIMTQAYLTMSPRIWCIRSPVDPS
uniref:Uncharacterized protein n=1 Tax=Anguilla anguilla TaxID=7936 RepID=A0A0E9T234_ANGAN